MELFGKYTYYCNRCEECVNIGITVDGHPLERTPGTSVGTSAELHLQAESVDSWHFCVKEF